jgi:hypothetical protein
VPAAIDKALVEAHQPVVLVPLRKAVGNGIHRHTQPVIGLLGCQPGLFQRYCWFSGR